MPEQCDRCPGDGVTTYVIPTGELVFCGHHSRAYELALTRIGCVSSLVYSTPVYPPQSWKAAGYGLPVNGRDRQPYERGHFI